jgi:predicted transcriptional regulator
MRFIPPDPKGRVTNSTKICDVPGCPHSTREGKPYCTDHVDHHPYVQDLISQLDENEVALERARNKGKVDLTGQAVRELILHLNLHGARTEERLARELQLDTKALQAILRALIKAGTIQLGHSKRGSTVVHLTGTAIPLKAANHDDTSQTA